MKHHKTDLRIGPGDDIYIAILVEKDGEGFHAFTPALKGLHVDGSTKKEAIERAKEAIDVYLGSLKKHGEKLAAGPGLMVVRKTKEKTSLQHVRTQWHSIKPFGTNLEIPQLTF